MDLDKLKYASHITKIIVDVTTEEQNSYKILQLYLNTLYMISETNTDLNFILSIFKIKLTVLLGFCPKIEECTNCGAKEEIEFFSLRDNGINVEIAQDRILVVFKFLKEH